MHFFNPISWQSEAPKLGFKTFHAVQTIFQHWSGEGIRVSNYE